MLLRQVLSFWVGIVLLAHAWVPHRHDKILPEPTHVLNHVAGTDWANALELAFQFDCISVWVTVHTPGPSTPFQVWAIAGIRIAQQLFVSVLPSNPPEIWVEDVPVQHITGFRNLRGPPSMTS